MKFLFVFASSLLLLCSSSLASSNIANNGDSWCRDDENFRYRQKQNVMGEETTGLLRNTKVLKDCEWIHHRQQYVDDEESTAPCNWHVDFDFVSDYCPVTCNTCQKKTVITQNKLSTDSLCYEAKPTRQLTSINITFENRYPQLEDWIGIYYSDTNSNHLPKEPIGWTYLTGNQQDMTKASYGYVTIETYLRPEHSYKAVLSRRGDKDGPYESYAESQIFEFTSHQKCEARRRMLQQQQRKDDEYVLEEDNTATAKPPSSSSSCSSDLSVDKSTYLVGEDIEVDLSLQTLGRSNLCFIQISNPDAYVAIYDATVDEDEIWGDNNYESFIWTCGSQSCHNHDVLEKIQFTKSTITTEQQWPIPAGQYKAHLIVPISKKRSTVGTTSIQGGGNPTQHERRRYYSVAQSPTFHVLQDKGNLANVGS